MQTEHPTGVNAGPGVRKGALVKLWAISLLAILLTAWWPAQAQQRQHGGRPERGQATGRPGPVYGAPAYGAPVYGAPAAPDRSQQHERMSPEERRQLRRDVFQHGREVYRERPDEGGSAKGRR